MKCRFAACKIKSVIYTRTETYPCLLDKMCGRNYVCKEGIDMIQSDFIAVGSRLILYAGEEESIIIPDWVTIIGEKAFSIIRFLGKSSSRRT